MSFRMSNTVAYSLLAPLLFVLHIIWEFGIGYWLFGLAGGIRPSPTPGGWTELGGIDWAWGTILYIPGCDILTRTNIGGCIWDGGEWGPPLLIIASIVSAIVLAQVIQAFANEDHRKFGRGYWRAFILFVGWVFVPLPVEWVSAYQITVLC